MAVQGEIQRNPVGKPLRFKTVKALKEAIQDYFDYCDNRVVNVYVKDAGENIPVSNPAPYTMSGLAYTLGISRQTLLDYSNRDEYLDTIKMARMRIEQDVETRLMEGKAVAGAIFNLKNNFGWVDKSEIDNKHEMVQPIIGGMAKQDVNALQSDNDD